MGKNTVARYFVVTRVRGGGWTEVEIGVFNLLL